MLKFYSIAFLRETYFSGKGSVVGFFHNQGRVLRFSIFFFL